jgi:predicted transcriptional regulator
MTKFDRVLKYVNARQEFTWKDFIARMKCQYACAETNYLSMLVNAGYVIRYSTGKYAVMYTSSGIRLDKLKEEAYG